MRDKYPLFFKLWSMSNVFLQKDNITILGDVYSYPHNKYDNENKLIETIEEKAIQLQIILVVNWKQRLFKANFELEWYKRIVHDRSEWEINWSLQLKDYTNWYILKEFLEVIWYDIDFNLTEKIELSQKEEI